MHLSRLHTILAHIDVLRILNASARVPKNRSSAVFQLITFQMFSTYAALPFKYYKLLVGTESIMKNDSTHLQIVCMLPHIDSKYGDFSLSYHRVLIFGGYDRKPLLHTRFQFDQPPPPTSLNAEKNSLECIVKGLFVTPGSFDLFNELGGCSRLGFI